jgi:hypothetical protein
VTFNGSRIGKTTLSVAILLAAASFFLAGLFNPYQPGTTAGTPGPAAASGPVTSVALSLTATPSSVRVDQKFKVSASLHVSGGPGPCTFTVTWPTQSGGNYVGSFTTMLDENGVYGFDTPDISVGLDPRTYTVTVKAEAGGASDTKSLVLTVTP